MRLTVLFDSPYWIGLLEVERDGSLYAARHIFGSEPSNQEIYEFVQRDLLALQKRMTVGLLTAMAADKHHNPKRAQREVRRQVAESGITSKAHEAMRLQIEQNKQQAIQHHRQQREVDKTYKREIARAKAKARHRGR
jgi:hypothetical protein